MEASYLNDKFFSRLETLSLNLRSNLAGYFGGKHLVSTYGQTVEFADYREYQLGDDIRRIDWNLYSRFEKHFLKLFTDERQMQIQIFLDCSASMGKDNPQKAAYAMAAAAAIGFLGVHNMDKVTYHVMKGNAADNPFGTIVGKTPFFRAIGELENVVYEGDSDIASCVLNTPDTGSNNGLSVIISDFFTESDWKKAVDYLVYKKRQVLLLQVMTPQELDPTYDGHVHMIDSEAEDMADPKNMKIKITRSMKMAYDEAMADFLEDIKSFCMKRNAGFMTVNTDTPIEQALFGQLLKTGIMA